MKNPLKHSKSGNLTISERVKRVKIKKEKFHSLSLKQKAEFARKIYEEGEKCGLIINNEIDCSHSVSAVALATEWVNDSLPKTKPRIVRYIQKYKTWSHAEKTLDPKFLVHDYSLSVLYEALDLHSKFFITSNDFAE